MTRGTITTTEEFPIFGKYRGIDQQDPCRMIQERDLEVLTQFLQSQGYDIDRNDKNHCNILIKGYDENAELSGFTMRTAEKDITIEVSSFTNMTQEGNQHVGTMGVYCLTEVIGVPQNVRAGIRKTLESLYTARIKEWQ